MMIVEIGKNLVEKFEWTVGGDPSEYLESKKDLLDYIAKLEKQIEDRKNEKLPS